MKLSFKINKRTINNSQQNKIKIILFKSLKIVLKMSFFHKIFLKIHINKTKYLIQN